ncbi:hypothetical protein AB1Y20_010909 [Prymnesium parvum]|uniref:Uncharacterized protein n=2 Tax=Prymnesium parvum TaxID=97485 RepID=A0AB34IST9_PRYPA
MAHPHVLTNEMGVTNAVWMHRIKQEKRCRLTRQPEAASQVVKLGRDLHLLGQQRDGVHQLVADHNWQLTHGPARKSWQLPTSSVAEMSCGVPTVETELVRPPTRSRERTVVLRERPNVDPRQLRDHDPCFMPAEPLRKLEKTFKGMVLQMPPMPAAVERPAATLELNAHVPAAWRRHELPLSHWDLHPERSALMHSREEAKAERGEARAREELAKLMAQVARMKPPRGGS